MPVTSYAFPKFLFLAPVRESSTGRFKILATRVRMKTCIQGDTEM